VRHLSLANCCFRVSLAILAIALSACGGGSSGSGNTNPAPFDTAKGEGVQKSGSLVTTYSTGGAGAAAASEVAAPEASPVPDLQTYYLETICPEDFPAPKCMQNQTNLDTPDFGNFDLSTNPIADNPLGIQNVDAFKITYGAINVDGTPVTVSGGLTVPELPAASIRGIVLYFHGTTVNRMQVPSNFLTADNPSGDTEGILLAALWASQGYIVAMPDYIGLGDDTANPHPYVAYPEESAQSALAMVKALHTALKDQFQQKLPLFITGYSEGGAYALEAGHLMQNNPRYAQALRVKLADVVPLSGAFDLTGTMLPYLFYNISSSANPWFSLKPIVSTLSKPYLSGDLVLSFAHYSGIAPTDIVVDPFYDCTESNRPNCGGTDNIDGLYYASGVPNSTVVAAMVVQAGQTNWTITNNSVEPLLTMAYAQALLNGDPTNPLYAQLLAANTYQFVPKFPLALVSLNQDSVVTRINTDVAFQYMTTQNPTGPYQEFLVDNSLFAVPGLIIGTDPVDHSGELPFLGVLALNQFNLNSPSGGM
jgi:hypothetical protein